MKRARKAKPKATDATAVAAEVDLDTGDTAGDQTSPDSAASPTPPSSTQADDRSPYSVAVDTFLELDDKAEQLRSLANNKKNAERCAERTYNYKIKRLDAGDKRNRRQGVTGGIKAVFRRYEAEISLLQAQHKSEWYQRKAAEAETAAAKAEAKSWRLAPAGWASSV